MCQAGRAKGSICPDYIQGGTLYLGRKPVDPKKRASYWGGSPQRPSLQLRLESLAFWAVEYALRQAGDPGEEIVLEAVK